MTTTNERLRGIEDKVQQIFKFLEIADVSQWQGMNVFEAGDADSLYGVLMTAFEQVQKEAVEDKVREIRGEIDEAINEQDHVVEPAGLIIVGLGIARGICRKHLLQVTPKEE